MVDFPRCAVCRLEIAPGLNVVFRRDGRVNHTECPPAICRRCGVEVKPLTPIRHDGPGVLHAICWHVGLENECAVCHRPFRRNTRMHDVDGLRYHLMCWKRHQRDRANGL